MSDDAATTMAARLEIPELRKRARLRRVAALGAVLLLGAAGLAYLRRPEPVQERFRTVAVAERSVVRLVEASGVVDARGRVEVPAPLPGRLTEILVKTREQVKAGQLLARLDERAAALTVKGAEAAVHASKGRLAEANAALAAAKQERAHADKLVERGLSSQQQAAAAAAAVERASAVVQAARAELSMANEQVASANLSRKLTSIVAPSDGVVLMAPEVVGQVVGPERGPLFVLAEPLEGMRIDAQVSETDIVQVRVGQPTHFEVQGLPGRRFDARVERIAIEPRREGGVAMYPVTLHAQNSDGVLLPGMTALVHLEVGRAEKVLTVHEAALRFTPPEAADDEAAPRARVWRRTGPHSVESVRVQAGLSDGAYTEVTPLEGHTLAAGDAIALGLAQPERAGAGKPGITLGGKK